VAGSPAGTVTFAFSDVEGSTRLWQEHPDHMGAALACHDQLVGRMVEAHRGYVFSTGGDSFGVAFDTARDAVSWAGAVHAGLADQEWPGGVGLRVRIGMHTGTAEERGGDYFGPAVNLAARISTLGHGGQTLVSAATAALVDDACLELGTYRVRDIAEPQVVLQVGHETFPGLRTGADHRGNLPKRLGRLIGRQQELEQLAAALEAGTSTTLVGPGGIGKTRLAIDLARRAAAEHPDGAWLVELASIADPGDVPRAVADVLGVTEIAGRSVTESIVTHLARRCCVLVLDNCEHVTTGARDLVGELLDGCSELVVVATSREGLAVQGERLVAVAPLEVDSAVALFAERASAVDPSFDLDAHRSSVEEVCARLDGVPLAIELAAARVRSLSPDDLARRLDDHFRLLTGGRRATVERHRTLRAAVEWSYDLLEPDERRLFDRLSVFVGWFDLAAVEAVCCDEDLDEYDAVDLLDSLIDRSMVLAASGPVGRRFRLLETLRQYGAERLAESGDTDRTARAHAHWYRDHAEELEVLLAGHDELEGVARVNQAWDNLRAAVAWARDHGDIDTGSRIAAAVGLEDAFRGRAEVGDWTEELAAAAPDDHPGLGDLLAAAGRRYLLTRDRDGLDRLERRWGPVDHPMWLIVRAYLHDDFETAVRVAPAAAEWSRARGSELGARMLGQLGVAGLAGLGRFAEALDRLRTLADEARRDGPPSLERHVLEIQGVIALMAERPDQARAAFARATRISVPDGTVSLTPLFETRALIDRGDLTGAARHLRDKLHSDIDNDTFMGILGEAALFMNLAGRLELFEPLTRVHRWMTSSEMRRRYLPLAGDALEQLAGRPGAGPGSEPTDFSAGRVEAGDVTLTHRELAAYMVGVLDEVLSGEASAG
jgi:predicted ATPase/class 3 adenylate cyclase